MAKTCWAIFLGSVAVAQATSVSQAPESAVELPSLPLVSDVLQKATKTVNAFTAKAASMQEKVLQRQKASKETLAKSKAHYEELLVGLENQTTRLTMSNAGLKTQVDQLAKTFQDMKVEAERLQRSNEVLWSSLGHLEAKIDAATQFTAESMRLSDLTGTPDLAVLTADMDQKSTLESFLKMAHSIKPNSVAQANKSHARPNVSLMQMSAHMLIDAEPLESTTMDDSDILHSRRSAETYVPLLVRSLEDLANAQREGEQALKEQFDVAAEEQRRHIEELTNEQESLRAARMEQRSRNSELAAARDHLKVRREQLVQRLNGVRLFASSIGKEATASMDAQTARARNPLNQSAPQPTNVTQVHAAVSAPQVASAGPTAPASLAAAQPRPAAPASLAAAQPGPTAPANSTPRTTALRAPLQAPQLTTLVATANKHRRARGKSSVISSSISTHGSLANASRSGKPAATSSWFNLY